MAKPIHTNGTSSMQTLIVIVLLLAAAYFIVWAFWPEQTRAFLDRVLP